MASYVTKIESPSNQRASPKHELEKHFYENHKKTSNKINPLIVITNNPRNYPELMAKCDRLEFLKVAKTLMKKALNRLKVTLPSNLAEVIEVSDGDIRQAINTIKFNSV